MKTICLRQSRRIRSSASGGRCFFTHTASAMRYVNFFALVFLVVVIGGGVQANAQDAVKSKAAAKAPGENASLALNLSDVAIFKSSSSEEGKVVISMAGQSSSAQNPTATTG